MGFFDNLSGKIVSAGQGAVQKGKDMADIARFNSLVADEEKKINNCYYQIGKYYAQKHENDFEEDFAGLFEALNVSIKNYNEYKNRVKVLKGIVNCPNCGAEVMNNLLYCNVCGQQMPITPENQALLDMVRCYSCGQLVNKNMKFCVTCGAPINNIDVPMNNTPEYFSDQQKISFEQCATDDSQAFINICPQCGLSIETGMDFCMECGFKIKQMD